MYFQSFSDAITMSGHGSYVWTAYGISWLVIAYLVWTPLAKKKRFFRDQVRRARRDQYQQQHSQNQHSQKQQQPYPQQPYPKQRQQGDSPGES